MSVKNVNRKRNLTILGTLVRVAGMVIKVIKQPWHHLDVFAAQFTHMNCMFFPDGNVCTNWGFADMVSNTTCHVLFAETSTDGTVLFAQTWTDDTVLFLETWTDGTVLFAETWNDGTVLFLETWNDSTVSFAQSWTFCTDLFAESQTDCDGTVIDISLFTGVSLSESAISITSGISPEMFSEMVLAASVRNSPIPASSSSQSQIKQENSTSSSVNLLVLK